MPRFDKSRLPSRYVTEGPEKAPMRAMMLGTGLAPEDLDKPLIGIATTWSESSPCNMPLHDQAQFVKTGVREAGAEHHGAHRRLLGPLGDVAAG